MIRTDPASAVQPHREQPGPSTVAEEALRLRAACRLLASSASSLAQVTTTTKPRRLVAVIQ